MQQARFAAGSAVDARTAVVAFASGVVELGRLEDTKQDLRVG